MRFSTVVSFVALSIAAAACSSSDSAAPAAKAGTVNPQAAKSTATQAVQASVTAVKSNDGQASAGQFMAAAMSAQGIITPSYGAMLQSEHLESSLAAGTCDCTGTTCTFTDCVQGGTTTMNGTMSWGSGHVTCDLTYKTTQTYPLQMTTKCDLTVSDTSIAGTLTSSGTVDLSGVSGGAAQGAYSWSSDTTFTAVTYASSGQPTGGSVTINASYEIAGQAYAGSATVTFP